MGLALVHGLYRRIFAKGILGKIYCLTLLGLKTSTLRISYCLCFVGPWQAASDQRLGYQYGCGWGMALGMDLARLWGGWGVVGGLLDSDQVG